GAHPGPRTHPNHAVTTIKKEVLLFSCSAIALSKNALLQAANPNVNKPNQNHSKNNSYQRLQNKR
ncbi:MAG: hypothetical protein K2Q97_19000, partial [Burkholderiaceae bacterium]|nr:hypothetical protein [Burkholderiaceae bacterium]